MKTRKYVSLLLVFSFIVVTITGIGLYVAPQGRVANWTNWQLMNASKSDLERMHTIWGYIMVILSIIHIYLNWNSIKAYIKKKKSKFISKELIISFLIFVILFLMVKKGAPPFNLIMKWGDKFSNSWEKKALSSPPVPHAENMSINELSKYVSYDANEILHMLQNRSIDVNSTDEIIGDIAKKNNLSPAEMYEIIQNSENHGNGRNGNHNGEDSDYEHNTSSIGYGQMTLNELCENENIDLNTAIEKLKNNNIEAKAEENLRDIADRYNMHPREIKDIIQ